MSDYDPIKLVQDATAFAESDFGKHYLSRLEGMRDGHYAKARTYQRQGDPALTASEIARADETQAELDYFSRSREIANSPTLMQKIIANLKRKESEKTDV